MCVECDLAEPESLASLGGSAPGVVDGIMSLWEISHLAESLISLSIPPHMDILSSNVLTNCLPDLIG